MPPWILFTFPLAMVVTAARFERSEDHLIRRGAGNRACSWMALWLLLELMAMMAMIGSG
jgi:hypothetical protein